MLYKFQNKLVEIPKNAVFNKDQSKFITFGTRYDALYVDKTKGEEVDLFDKEEVTSVEAVTCDEKNFWVLANKRYSALGVYLFGINIENPNKESEFLLNWSHKLDIADGSMFVMYEADKEFLVISHKSVGINTFNVFVIDL